MVTPTDRSGGSPPGGIDPEQHRKVMELARWLIALDDIEGPGAEVRKTVTLTQIIERARAAVGDESSFDSYLTRASEATGDGYQLEEIHQEAVSKGAPAHILEEIRRIRLGVDRDTGRPAKGWEVRVSPDGGRVAIWDPGNEPWFVPTGTLLEGSFVPPSEMVGRDWKRFVPVEEAL